MTASLGRIDPLALGPILLEKNCAFAPGKSLARCFLRGIFRSSRTYLGALTGSPSASKWQGAPRLTPPPPIDRLISAKKIEKLKN